MNDTKTIEIRGNYDNCFYLKYCRASKLYLKDFLINFDLNDYHIYKSTNQQRQVTIDEFLEFNYGCYILYIKNKYDKDYIDKWIPFLNSINMQYLIKPLPPFSPNKIIIKQ